mmetsp:Transcript_5657/g.7573  ORF Transcript_5657/g.7573 Transcript_5657/m.7573 type:complete len:207 (+) Transcript_5657:109-729(+)
MYIILGSNLLLGLIGVFQGIYYETIEDNYEPYTETREAFSLSTEDQTLAGLVKTKQYSDLPYDDFKFEELYQVQYYQRYRTANKTNEFVWLNTALCKDIYADQIADNPQLDSEFGNDWVCPDVSNINLLNSPTLFKAGEGAELFMIVNKCSIAADVNERQGLTTYADKDTVCMDTEDPEKFKELSNFFVVDSKIMSRDSSSPSYYQ